MQEKHESPGSTPLSPIASYPGLLFRAIFLLAPCGLLSLFLFGDLIVERLSRRAFDSATWKADKGSPDNPVRLRMVDSLLHHHLLEGKTQQEIEELLGPPTYIRMVEQESCVYRYWLGPERGLVRIDCEVLDIRFEGKTVVNTSVRTD